MITEWSHLISGLQMRLRCRPHWTCNASHIIWPLIGFRHHIHDRIFCLGFDYARRKMLGNYCDEHGGRNSAQNKSKQHHLGNRRLRSCLLFMHFSTHMHWWRKRNGPKSWHPSARSRIRSVSPHWYLWSWLPNHRGLQRRGRYIKELRGWEIHGALRTIC